MSPAQKGGISLLDLPLRGRIAEVFEHPGNGYAKLLDRLYLTSGPYQNPYELVTFYDNHDMAHLAASGDGFIDANAAVHPRLPPLSLGNRLRARQSRAPG